MTDAQRDELLAHFAVYAPTQWGLAQAVARVAQDVVDPDDAFDLERAAGKLATSTTLAAALR